MGSIYIIFVIFHLTLNVLYRLPRNPQISNFMKIRPVGAELFHAHGQTHGRTDVTKQIVAFHNFTIAPKVALYRESLNNAARVLYTAVL
jgi:hypothetical protein